MQSAGAGRGWARAGPCTVPGADSRSGGGRSGPRTYRDRVQGSPPNSPPKTDPLGYRMGDRGAAHRLGGDLGEPRLHMAHCL